MIEMSKFREKVLFGLGLFCLSTFVLLPSAMSQFPPDWQDIIMHAFAMTMDDIDTSKMFYKPSEETWQLVEYKESMEEIEKFEKFITGLKLGGLLPELDIVFEGLAHVLDFIGSVTQHKSEIFWSMITGEMDKRILEQKMSDMRSKIEAFKSSAQHLAHEDAPFTVEGFRQIEDILAFFSEPGSILRKYPLHSSPLVLGFIPVMVVYIEYAGKKYPNIEEDWRSTLQNKAIFVLEVYKRLSIKERIEACESVRSIDDREPCFFCGHGPPTHYELSDFIKESHDSPLGQFPKWIRCRKVDPSVGCDQTGRQFWKHTEREKTDYLKYIVECITDRFTKQVVLAASAFDMQEDFPSFGVQRNFDEEERMNCLVDYIKVIEYLYQTMFWRVASLMV